MEHRHEALRVELDFLERQPWRLVMEEGEPGEHLARLQIDQDPPPRLSMVVGDVVHNLRSALDILAWRLACRHDRDHALAHARRIAFPIAAEPAKFDSKWWHRCFGDAAALVERVQPYERTPPSQRSPLLVLHDMWNEDKHRAIQAAVGMLVIDRAAFRPRAIDVETLRDGPEVERLVAVNAAVSHGEAIVRVRFAGVEQLGMTGADVTRQPDAHILFGRHGMPGQFLGNMCAEVGFIATELARPLAND